ncbi:hypothetical protein OIDMADRAFT_50995 [Oidiodendron maius Zn]|uniref:Uncharacterized protein n=1 Tax=Oidiodendron maius (strain Zn) TaxID=913774 RepID=A0A0C3DSY0_OIDMZ|nr:hypothetical protein OIDMADRAFT_50995 [Oidiodendron maius Zn]
MKKSFEAGCIKNCEPIRVIVLIGHTADYILNMLWLYFPRDCMEVTGFAANSLLEKDVSENLIPWNARVEILGGDISRKMKNTERIPIRYWREDSSWIIITTSAWFKMRAPIQILKIIGLAGLGCQDDDDFEAKDNQDSPPDWFDHSCFHVNGLHSSTSSSRTRISRALR